MWEEVKDDDAELPTYDGKIVGKVEKMDSALKQNRIVIVFN